MTKDTYDPDGWKLLFPSRSEGISQWDEVKEYPVEDWRHEVACDYVRVGYLEWVAHRWESDYWDNEMDEASEQRKSLQMKLDLEDFGE